ncbi:MAG: hypothetical protein HDR88_15280 [Bacteroides sp.]|nr:hypothetical protein [Bacteroides sp.]
MKIFKFITAALAMLFISNGTTVNADDVIVRHMTKEGKTERLVVDHTQLPDLQKAIRESKPLDRFKTSSENPTATLIKSPMRDPGPSEQPEGFAVRFAVEEEEAPNGWIYDPWKVYVCKGDGAYGREYYNYAYYPDEYMIEQGYAWGCYVPEGEYTIILCSEICEMIDAGERGNHVTDLYVVKENVKIDGETTITFRQSEAKNLITASCLLPDGTEAPATTYIYDENGNWLGQRNDLWVGANRSFVNINGDYSLNLGRREGYLDYVYINDISSNWVYVINMAVVDENGAYANCVTHPGPITSSMHIQNDPSNYELTTVKFNSSIPGVNTATKGFGIAAKIAWKGSDWNLQTGGMIFDSLGISDELPLYINAKPSDLVSPTAFDLITVASVATDKIKIMAEDWDGNPILDENGEQLFYYSYPTISAPGLYRSDSGKYMCIDSYGYDIEEYPDESFLLPYDKDFSWEKTSESVFFSDAPVLSVMADSFIRDDYSRFMILPSFYYPCQSSYNLPYSFSMDYNGQSVIENGTEESFDWFDWSLENYKEPGVVDVRLSAVWNNDDPGAILSNEIHIDTRNEDYWVPQITRWQLRNTNGSITQEANAESVIYLMCLEDTDADFQLSVSSQEISDYIFNVEKIQEEPFYEMGNWNIRQVYKVTLEDFPGEVGKKYSLKFNLSDASGNTSTQTIGNAFEWNDTTGINSATADDNVYVADSILHAPAAAEVFTIDGRRANGNTLTSGLYIVKIGNKTTKVLVP